MKPKPKGINMVERAIIANKWKLESVDAKIHALIGDNSREMVHLAGKMLYVALGAALAEKMDSDDVDVRIIRGAVNAVHDQAEVAAIDPLRRASIVSGLEAVSRLCQRVERKSLIDSACDLALKMRSQHLHYSDFAHLIAVA